MMIGEVLTVGLFLIAVGSFLYYAVTLDGIPTRRFSKPFSGREYVNKYCPDCGHQKTIGWNVYKYDTNTGKPATYRWWVSCPECGNVTDRVGGIVTEYEYVNREYGVIPNTGTDTDKPEKDKPLRRPRLMNEYGQSLEIEEFVNNWRGKRPDER